MQTIRSPFTASFAAAVLLACGSALSSSASATTPPDPQQAIGAYWEAAKVSDWQTTWFMEHAAVVGTDDPYHYYQRMKAQWPVLRAELGASVVDDGKAEVTLELLRGMPLGGVLIPRPESRLDRWTWLDGQWRHVETVALPAPGSDEAPAGEAGEVGTGAGSEPLQPAQDADKP